MGYRSGQTQPNTDTFIPPDRIFFLHDPVLHPAPPHPELFPPPTSLVVHGKGHHSLDISVYFFVFQTLAPVRLRAEAMRSHFGDVEVMRNKLDLKDEEIKEIKRLIKIKVRLHDYVRVFREIHQY